MPKGIYDRPKAKPNKGFTGHKHTQKTLDKISFILNGMKKSRNFPAWNKGICGIGGNHTRWKGDSAKYGSKHDWVAKWKGKPNYCEICGTKERRRYHWANIDHKYRRVLEDYIRLCVSCHKKYDLANKIIK